MKRTCCKGYSLNLTRRAEFESSNDQIEDMNPSLFLPNK